MRPVTPHEQRIKDELSSVGVTWYGRHKFNTHFIPKLIHEYEHIKGVIYGRFREDGGFLSMADHMLVATDLRIISFNHKPGYTDIDEFTYDAVIGVDYTTAGPFSSVTLQTRLRDFTLRFVNPTCAKIFITYLEARRFEYHEQYPLLR